MKDLWQFLGFRSLDWREARLEDIGEFVAWLQLPPAGRAGEVAVLAVQQREVPPSAVPLLPLSGEFSRCHELNASRRRSTFGTGRGRDQSRHHDATLDSTLTFLSVTPKSWVKRSSSPAC